MISRRLLLKGPELWNTYSARKYKVMISRRLLLKGPELWNTYSEKIKKMQCICEEKREHETL